MADVLVIGAGIGGLTLALELHKRGIACQVYESAPAIKAVGVGINILPHASAVLAELGLEPALARVAVETAEAAFFNRFGQLIYKEALGKRAGYQWPQFSIHRGDLQTILLEAVKARLGADRLHLGWHCLRFEQNESRVTLKFKDRDVVEGKYAVACDGIHSVIRKQLYPDEGEPHYTGVNMWRGVTTHAPFLSGATMVRAGWLTVGKMVIYPIRDRVDDQGRQLVNWVAELEAKAPVERDWNARGRLGDFFAAFADWHFDWLDVAALIEGTETVLAYPMVDQDPLPRWSFGRVTLLGDAAHPMVPRGSNGAGQAILDARFLADRLVAQGLTPEALTEYDRVRNAATAKVVLMNRSNPPDAILREVHERSGDRPFARIEDVVSRDELARIADAYKQVAGLTR